MVSSGSSRRERVSHALSVSLSRLLKATATSCMALKSLKAPLRFTSRGLYCPMMFPSGSSMFSFLSRLMKWKSLAEDAIATRVELMTFSPPYDT